MTTLFRRFQFALWFLPIIFFAILSGCGGGSGGGAASSTLPTTSAYSISGTVTGASGVAMSLAGASTASTIADASGNYSFANLANGSYTVTPSRTGYTFSPTSLSANVNGANLAGKNFLATASNTPTYGISGSVSGVVAQGVTINLTGASASSAVTDVNGNYNISGLANGSYTIVPTLSGYTFSPNSSVVAISGVNSTANNFTSATALASSYIYFKRGASAVPQTATLASNGTLSIDGKTITGVYPIAGVGGSTCLAGGAGTTITACASPPYLPNMMLLCGPDPVTAAPGTLLYVLFNSPDVNLANSNATALLNALQSGINYMGIGVYTDCSGIGHTSWIRNYPNTNYYLWPNVFTTYTSAYVSTLLNGAVIYSTPTAGNNFNQYVAVRVSTTVFEVWH